MLKYPAETTLAQFEATLFIEYRHANNDNSFERGYGYISMQLQPTMKHTLKALVSVGTVDQMTIDGWLLAD